MSQHTEGNRGLYSSLVTASRDFSGGVVGELGNRKDVIPYNFYIVTQISTHNHILMCVHTYINIYYWGFVYIYIYFFIFSCTGSLSLCAGFL